MSSRERSLFQTFIVRYRLEPTEAGQLIQLRGTVIHLPSDKSMMFKDPEEAFRFMQKILDAERA